MGKSALAEHLFHRHQSTVRFAWGRAWEAGGAPPYWPWIEVLRSLMAQEWQPCAPGRLARLLPELGQPERCSLPPNEARFQLLEALVQDVCDAAAASTSVIVLEDMHVADASSLLALGLLASRARSVPLMVVATAREVELRRNHASTLQGLLRAANVIHLGPLSEEATREYVVREIGSEAPSSVDSIYDTTEGHPLFLVETVRARRQHRASDATPPNVRAVLRDHLSQVDEEVQKTLQIASVWGREVSLERLGGVLETKDTVARHLLDAVEAGILVVSGPDIFRFRHILLREVAYQELPHEERRRLHERVAYHLERHVTPSPWGEIVHHLRAASSPRLAEAAQAAGEDAAARLAFEEAVEFCRLAAGTAPPYAAVFPGHATDSADDADRIEYAERVLSLAVAQLRAGYVDDGRRTCLEVASLARRVQRPHLLLRSALTYGSVFVPAEIDRELIHLLEEGLAAVQGERNPLVAEAMARLAAAQQPSPDPALPIAMARQAIEMARTFESPEVLQRTLCSASSAMMDLGDPRERLAVNREHIALAERAGDLVESWRGHARAVFDAAEIGDFANAETLIDLVWDLAERMGLPHYRWLAAGLRAMACDRRGEFERAEEYSAVSADLAAKAGAAKARQALAYQRAYRFSMQGRWPSTRRALTEALAESSEMWFAGALCAATDGEVAARMGQPVGLSPEDVEATLRFGDRSTLAPLASIAWCTGELGPCGSCRSRACAASRPVCEPRTLRFVGRGTDCAPSRFARRGAGRARAGARASAGCA